MSQNDQSPGFVDGLIAKAPHERAPEFVKAKLAIKREAFIAWLEQQDGEWINLDVKESRGGKWYAAVDEWKPDRQAGDGERANGNGYGNGTPRRHGPQTTRRQQSATDRYDDRFEPDEDIPFVTNQGRF